MLVEKVPSLKCDKCGSHSVIKTNGDIECDDCSRITVLSTKKEVLKERCDRVVHFKRRSKKK
jgi:hypothetical protein